MVLTYRGLLAIRGAPIDWDHSLDAGDGDEDTGVVLLRQYFECQRIGSQTDKKTFHVKSSNVTLAFGIKRVRAVSGSMCVSSRDKSAFKTEWTTD